MPKSKSKAPAKKAPAKKRTSSTSSPSRTTKAKNAAAAGLAYVAGWLPADLAEAVRAQIAGTAATAHSAKTSAKRTAGSAATQLEADWELPSTPAGRRMIQRVSEGF